MMSYHGDSLCTLGSKQAIMEGLTPQELANTTNRGLIYYFVDCLD